MKWIVMLGMHRSGTSALTQAIGSLGAYLGNPRSLKKHLENIPMRRLNERLLRSAGGAWDAPPPVGWLDTVINETALEQGRRMIHDQFEGHGEVTEATVAVWKDPRACVTMPFWLKVLPDPVFVLVYRHPTEVAASLTARSSMGVGHGYALWERYNGDALAAIEGRPTVVLDYPSVLADPVGQLAFVQAGLASFGVDLPHDPASAEHGLVPQARHHTAEDTAQLAPIATDSQRSLYAALEKLHGSHAAFTLAEPIPEPHPLSTELLAMAGHLATKESNRRGAPSDPPLDAGSKDARRGRSGRSHDRTRGHAPATVARTAATE